MRQKPVNIYLLLILFLPPLLLTQGCTHKPQNRLISGNSIIKNTTWAGTVQIAGTVTVEQGATLQILPGTRVLFFRDDADRDGFGDATIVVKGSLVARGTEAQPILFASAEEHPQVGDWLEIRSDFARELAFDWCEFRDSAYTLHAHFTRGYLRNSHIHHNLDGSRLGRSKFDVSHNLIEENQGKGINFRDSQVSLTSNIIRHNGVGIFLFEKPGQSVISGNNIYANDMNLRLGDFFTDDVSLSNNWWGAASSETIFTRIYDRRVDPEVGAVTLEPARRWHVEAGIRRAGILEPAWSYPTEGFVDASIQALSGMLIAASWDTSVVALTPGGEVIWKAELDDVVDGGFAHDENSLYLQTWSRSVFQVNLISGRAEKLFSYPESLADDHRQAGLLLHNDWLLIGAWNGSLYALNLKDPSRNWSYDVGMPLRATPVVEGSQIYLSSGSGLLSVIDFDGKLLWQKDFQSPLLSSVTYGQDRFFQLDKSGNLNALSGQGEQLWSISTGEKCFYGQPVLSGNELFFATAGQGLWKVDSASGEVVWRIELPEASYATPVLFNHYLLVGDNAGTLSLIDRDSGRVLSQVRLNGAIQSTPLVIDQSVYVGSRDKQIHAFILSRPPLESDPSDPGETK